MPLEIVMQLFRRMGWVVLLCFSASWWTNNTDGLVRPRVILVSREGALVGLVTVKDVLRHEASQEHAHRLASLSAQPTPTHPGPHTRGSSLESANGWADSWAAVEEDQGGRGLEIALEEGWGWVRLNGLRAWNVVAGGVRGRGGGAGGGAGGGGDGGADGAEFSYELEEERSRTRDRDRE